jgi:uncharacterized linocin/CFP29 family protein
MHLLRRELAPLEKESWKVIDSRAAEVLKSRLSARKVVRVEGPKGWDYTAITEGKLSVKDDFEDEVKIGRYQIKPLIESHISFSLNRWDMDNIVRGARDIDLDSLENAAEKIALFEEDTIYNGNEICDIKGILGSVVWEPIDFGKNNADIIMALIKAMDKMKKVYQQKPYTLVVGQEAWERLNTEIQGYPFTKRVKDLIGGEIVQSKVVNNAILLPQDNEDLELVLGGDYTIGYIAHDSKNVRLFIAMSFTFRVIDPQIIIPFKI